jgi:hypothetical protein
VSRRLDSGQAHHSGNYLLRFLSRKLGNFFFAPRISLIVAILEQMSSKELEALAVRLYAQMNYASNRSEVQSVDLEDVKDWIASHKKETQSCSELSFFLNMV